MLFWRPASFFDPLKARAAAPDYDIRAERAYGSYGEMVAAESALPAGERIDFVTIATPNDTHFEIARSFAEVGFNVVCDKPMTFDLMQAKSWPVSSARVAWFSS